MEIQPMPVPAPAVEPTTWETIRDGIVDGAKWFGRQVVAFFTAIADYAVRAWEWAKPKFIDAKDWIVDKAGRTKDWIVEHKKETIIATVAACIGIVVTCIIHAACCPKAENVDDSDKKPKDKEEKKAV